MDKLSPTRQEIEALRARAPEGPVLVINLLKFKPGPDALAAYRRYLDLSASARHPDCTVIHIGPAFHDFGSGQDWDYVIIASYPRFADFAWTVTHAAWERAARERPAALERTVMLVTSAGNPEVDFAG